MTLLAPARHRLGRVLAVAFVLPLALAGCDSVTDAEQPRATLSPAPIQSAAGSETPAPAQAGLRRFYDQKLAWKGCEGGDQCATLRVPLDYADPAGRAITLSLLKVPARDQDRRVGSLVVNPGGPGGSGVDYAASATTYFGTELLNAFDVVGFDPRGVGRSTPVQCLSDAELDDFVASDPDPDTAAELATSDRLLRDFGQGCVAESGALAAHVSTEEAARDIDILRAALGDDRLSYFGASYGTFLGATYAEEFPQRVGRMVLDGALDPSVSSLELNLTQAKGFETALRAYVGACVDRGDCFLGDSVDAGAARVRALLDDIERDPLQVGDRTLEAGNAVLGVWAPLYNKSYWPILDGALKTAIDGDGQTLLALSDAYTSRGATGYKDNSLEALYAVNCLDHDDAIPSSQVARYIPRFEKASPTFGAIFAFSLSSCAQWPIDTGRVPQEIHARGAAPILVVGTTRDPATPLEWAASLADQLDSGVLVRRDGDGHTGYLAGNKCVDSTVESYLVSGKVPEGTVNC
ncbi:alpha/beta hydrolase [Nocardioides mesophilus]|uniref:Alpha/beta fold hydrolase n=1 Tax=Nocardioides mesophilus TaxID=433659 RepID=A0A7G9RGF4_9ACTN|nr:alpha/beta hydrolase [Nocardioides mesophilus]QNN54679.1 alpha/beta fold hydrolase [Nocardioides mesophilus]